MGGGLGQADPGLTETRTKHPWTLQSYGDCKLMASGVFPFGIPRANPHRGTRHDPCPPLCRRHGLPPWLRLCHCPDQLRPAPLPLRLWLRPELRLHPGSSLWLRLHIDAGLIHHRGRKRPLPFHGLPFHGLPFHGLPLNGLPLNDPPLLSSTAGTTAPSAGFLRSAPAPSPPADPATRDADC